MSTIQVLVFKQAQSNAKLDLSYELERPVHLPICLFLHYH